MMKFQRFRAGAPYHAPFAAAAFMSVALSAPAAAQGEPTPNPPSPTIPRPPQTPAPNPPPQPIPPQPPGATPVNPGDTLSEKLDKGDGVLTPPPVGDPDIVMPPPDTNAKIKVIPPPGEPGGDPRVQPK